MVYTLVLWRWSLLAGCIFIAFAFAADVVFESPLQLLAAVLNVAVLADFVNDAIAVLADVL